MPRKEKSALNSSISDCSNETEEAKMLFSSEEVVFASNTFPYIMILGFLTSSAFIRRIMLFCTICNCVNLLSLISMYCLRTDA